MVGVDAMGVCSQGESKARLEELVLKVSLLYQLLYQECSCHLKHKCLY